jgi:hypothetical protein
VLALAKKVVWPKTGCFRLPNFSLGLFLLAGIAIARPVNSADVASLDEAIRQLAERISGIPNLKGPIRLEVHQDAAFDETEGPSWQTTLRRELDRHKLSITEESAAPLLRVGATETPTQIVLAADLLFAGRQEFRVVALKRAALQPEILSASPVRIEKQLLFESSERILDAAPTTKAEAADLTVLIYRNSDLNVLRLGRTGTVKQSVSLSAAGSGPTRDPRAELIPTENDDQVQLPGKLCEFNWSTPAEMKCHTAKTVWRAPPTLTSPCDSTSWKPEADGNDSAAGDVLRVLPEEASRQGRVALLSDFTGPILSINRAHDYHSALVVVRNLRTGNYEVYKITLACGN